jgi:phospholipase C
MAIIIAYDDSGGFYDHEMPPIINQSQIPEDVLPGTIAPIGGYQGRPSYGYRLPFLLISPWAKKNYVDSGLIDQTSILRFIEDNWKTGRIGDYSFDAFAGSLRTLFDFDNCHKEKLILDPVTGQNFAFQVL